MTKEQKLNFFREELKKTCKEMDSFADENLTHAIRGRSIADSHFISSEYEPRIFAGMGLLAGHIALLADCLEAILEEEK